MRLKKLTLFGFKSFPNRTKIEFSSGICAIVGPNGCGKSNVVDAIRWVLGEQSAKMLRARSMDDVIFSGSNGRSVNFAEVSLVLENRAGMAPPEFEDLPEIEIKRMVSRKGDTRYLINGRTCRLKDIHYLLMDTGAGTRAYSIVDQGQVGQFVEMSPQERRHIIEEVAGISRYKARRVEAERRMSDTSRNLERLNDLITEVERQLRSASRQAKKTERYLALRKEEESLDRALLRYAWDEQVQRVDELEREMDRAQATLDAAAAGLAALNGEKEGINAVLLERDDELKKIKKGLEVAERLLGELRSKKADAEKQLYRSRLRLQTVEESSAESEKRVRGTERRHKEVIETLDRLKERHGRLKVDAEKAASAVDEARHHVEQVQSEVEEVKVLLVDAAAEQARLDSERRNLKERGARLQKRIEKRKQELREAEDRLRTLREEHAAKESELKGLAGKLAECGNRLEAAEQELSDTTRQLSEKRKLARDTGASLAALNARLQALRAVEASGEGIPQEVQALLAREQGVLGMLADFIDVERGWERLFETALGPRLHAVVVDSLETCSRIAGEFRRNGSGTLNIIISQPLNGDDMKRHNTPDYLPVASDTCSPDSLAAHVRASAAVVPVIRHIVSDAQRADSLEHAIEKMSGGTVAHNHGDLSRMVMVTEEGDLVSSWMEVSVQGEGSEASGLLVRKAMIRELAEESEQLSSELQALKAGVQSLEALEAEQRRSVSALQKEKKALQATLSKLKGALESLDLRIESASSRLEVAGFEIGEAQEELLDVELGLEEKEIALEECNKRYGGLKSSLSGREKALSQQQGVLERRKQKLQEIRIELARLESNIREREKEKRHLERQKERIVRDRKEFAAEKGRLEKAIADHEHRLAQAVAKEEAQQKAVSSARSRAAAMEDDRDQILQELSTIESRIMSQDKVVKDAEKKVHTLELELSEARQALQYIGLSSLERHMISAAAINDVDELLQAMSVEEIKGRLDEVRSRIQKIGAVNLGALDEYNELKERHEFLDEQKKDLEKSMADLKQAIDKINRTCRSRFREALDAVNSSLDQVFPLLFEGGSARLQLDSSEDVLEAGVEYMVNLPGKRIQHLNLLSGGEKTMAAMALLFAVYFIKPSPFCLLDEVDAPLDEANTDRFNRLIRKIAKESQVVIITHNQRVMDTADTLYGVTMEDRGVSKIVSVNLVSDN